MSEVARRLGLLVVFILIAPPHFAHAQVAAFVFTSDPQTIGVSVVSQQLSVQAQTAAGTGVAIPSTACLSFTSTSPQGQFSSSATAWNPVSVLTMNKSTMNKNFYYQDAQAGTQTLTVKVSLKPDSVTSSCANWALDQWTVEWTATQNIIVGGSSTTADVSTTTSQTNTQQTQTTVFQAPVSSYVAPPVPQIFVDAGGDRTVIVGADAEFGARAYDRTRNVLNTAHVRFLWNFGDGTTSEGPAVLHHFEYPGRYAVVIDIAEDKSAGSDTVIVTAEPAKLAWKALLDGGVEIDNLAGRDLDLSGWLVRAGPGVFASLFRLPPHSVILSGSSMRIARTTLGFTAGAEVELQYPNGVAVAPSATTNASAPAPASSAAPAASPPSPASSLRADAAPASDPPAADTESPASVETEAREGAGTSAQVAAAASAWGGPLWWLGALGVALAAGGAVFVAKRFGKGEWNIVEERGE